MTFDNITSYPRFWDQAKYPIVAHVEIDPKNFDQLERRTADQTQVSVLGHDESDHGLIVVHVGCTSEDAKRRFERRWTA